MAGKAGQKGVAKPVRRSQRTRRQYNPDLLFNATAYMKAAPSATVIVKPAPATAPQKARSLGALLDAVYSIFNGLKLRLSLHKPMDQRKRSKKAAAGRRKKASK
jgi:hypothetical protein